MLNFTCRKANLVFKRNKPLPKQGFISLERENEMIKQSNCLSNIYHINVASISQLCKQIVNKCVFLLILPLNR